MEVVSPSWGVSELLLVSFSSTGSSLSSTGSSPSSVGLGSAIIVKDQEEEAELSALLEILTKTSTNWRGAKLEEGLMIMS